MTAEEQLKQLQQQLAILKTQKEIAELQAALQQKPAETQQAIAQARKAALEAILPKGEAKPLEGTTTTDEKSGYPATIIAYQVLRNCASAIAESIDSKRLAGDPVKLLIVEERNMTQGDLVLVEVERQFAFFRAQLSEQTQNMDHLLQEMTASYPKPKVPASADVPSTTAAHSLEVFSGAASSLVGTTATALLMGVPAVLSVAADIAGYFKTDYTIKGQLIELGIDALIAEVAGKIKNCHVQIFNFNLVQNAVLVNDWGKLVEQKIALDMRKEAVQVQIVQPITIKIAALEQVCTACQNELAQLTRPEDEARRDLVRADLEQHRQELAYNQILLSQARRAVASADALAQAYSEFVTTITARPYAAALPLWVQAAVRQQIRQEGITHLLYLKVVSSGGEFITSKNYFGWKSCTSYVGGAVAAYILAKTDGQVVLAGTETGMAQMDYQYSHPDDLILYKISFAKP